MMASAKEGTYDWAVALIRSYLSIFGLWIYPNCSTLQRRCSYLPICVLNCYLFICVIIPEMWALYRIRRDMELVIGNLMVSLTFYLSIFKTFFLLYRREELRQFFDRIEEDWNAYMTENEREILTKRWKLIRYISVSAFIIALVLSLTHNSTVYFNFVVRVLTNLTDTIPGRPLVFSSVYPFDTQPSPRYELMVFAEQLEGTLACITAIIPDVLYAAFVFHTCGELEILSSRIEGVSENRSENFNQFLKSSVTHHLRIIKLVENIDNLFNGFILLLILYFTLVFCSQSFMAMTVTARSGNKDEMVLKLIFFMCYTSYLMFLTFLYCWASEALSGKSEYIRIATYNCNWIDLPPNKAILLRLISLRSQRPLGVTAGKILPVTLNTYAKLLKTCGGYVSMLLFLFFLVLCILFRTLFLIVKDVNRYVIFNEYVFRSLGRAQPFGDGGSTSITRVCKVQITTNSTMAPGREGTYDGAVGLIRSSLSICGLWTYPNSSLLRRICSYLPICFINFYLFVCVVIPQLWALYRIRRDMELVIGNLMVSLTFCLSIIKTFFLLFRREVLGKFFEKIEEDWRSQMTENERNILINRWRLIQKLSISAFIMAIALPIAHNSCVYFNFVVRVITNLTDIIPGRQLVFSSVYPFDFQASPRYELMVFFEQLEGILTCTTAIIPDVLYATFVFHACGQLEILSSRIEEVDKNSVKNFNHFLKTSVVHHLRIIKFVENIDNLFNGFILLLILYFTLVFCSQAFMAMTVTARSGKKDEIIMKLLFFASYTSYLMFLTFLYCWASETLSTKSAGIHNAAYNCDWINLPHNKALSLCMISLRSQRPLGVTAGKFLPVTLNTYAKLLKTCGGYVSMLLAMHS
ncbi:uncharacterized protein LOC135165757 [Diachasmimorpha longicaudata]|uniref:uncharacterized protein LOC135165757 n=1 Tax=Diachasmimorpha longicaudata TaxID=58733 RepID=UPI0030B8A68D